jgi:hypothetical protein
MFFAVTTVRTSSKVCSATMWRPGASCNLQVSISLRVHLGNWKKGSVFLRGTPDLGRHPSDDSGPEGARHRCERTVIMDVFVGKTEYHVRSMGQDFGESIRYEFFNFSGVS